MVFFGLDYDSTKPKFEGLFPEFQIETLLFDRLLGGFAANKPTLPCTKLNHCYSEPPKGGEE